MKPNKPLSLFVCIFLVLSNLYTYSQNWSLLNSNYKYHYSISSSQKYNTTILVDSFDINGADTLFYLNRIVTDCDTCPIGYMEYYKFYNQPVFLQKKALRHNNIYTFFDTITFYIEPFCHVGETWLFDSLNNISAAIIDVNIENIFGVTDSMKYIKLSTNDTIIISKQFGIIQFPIIDSLINYNLIGIETPYSNYGFTLPDFFDFFNFKIGDIFQRRAYSSWCGDGCDTYTTDTKMTILSKNTYDDSITYIVNKNCKYWAFENSMPYGDTSYYNYIDTVTYTKYDCSICNLYNKQLYSELFYETKYAKAIVDVDESGIVSNTIGESYFVPTFYTIFNEDINLLRSTSPDYYFKSVTVGLGQSYRLEDFEAGQGDFLVGYIKNGDTIGNVNPDYLVNVNNIIADFNNFVKIYPNPANNVLNVNLIRFDNNSIIRIIIYDIFGKEIISYNTRSNLNKIDIGNLKKGIYMVLINCDGRSDKKKIIIN